MEWMKSHSNVELIFATVLNKIFVSANTSGFQSFRAQLFIFVRHKMNAQWEFLDESLLAAQIKDTNLGIRNTTTET